MPDDVKSTPKEEKPAPEKRLDARSWWPTLIGGFMLVEAGGEFRLTNRWPGKRKFTVNESEFKSFAKPDKFSILGVNDEDLWKAGIARRGDYLSLSAAQQALHHSGANLSPQVLIEALKLKE